MYVLCHRKSRPTGRKIAAALGMNSRFKTPRPNDNIAIRWGSAQFGDHPSDIQSASAISRAANKLIALQCFKRDGVPHPPFSAVKDNNATDIWLGRAMHGMCGTDIVVYQPGQHMVRGHDFFTKYIPSAREYRIHVFGDEVLGVMGKYLDYPDQAGEGYIKNASHGYRFRTPSKQLKADRTDAAIAAVKSLGLDFGAVDLIVAADGSGAYVLEVNTAPALAPLTARKYVTAFANKLGVTIREDKMGAFA